MRLSRMRVYRCHGLEVGDLSSGLEEGEEVMTGWI